MRPNIRPQRGWKWAALKQNKLSFYIFILENLSNLQVALLYVAEEPRLEEPPPTPTPSWCCPPSYLRIVSVKKHSSTCILSFLSIYFQSCRQIMFFRFRYIFLYVQY